jgi:hypothetical protein
MFSGLGAVKTPVEGIMAFTTLVLVNSNEMAVLTME